MTFQMGSADMERLLVTLHDKHRIYALAKDKRGFARQELAGIMTDILDLDLTHSEQELMSDIFISLLKQAEQDLKLEIARRLARQKSAPLRLILHLAHDEIETAAIILSQSKSLEPFDIDCILSATPISHWRAVAGRSDLTEAIINRLAEADDAQTDMKLLENRNITLPEMAMTKMAELAKDHPALLQKLSARPELTQEIVSLIYQFAGEDIKADLSLRFELKQEREIMGVIDRSVRQKTDMSVQQALKPGLQACLDNLNTGDHEGFLTKLGTYCNMRESVMKECLMDGRGRKLAALARACDIPKSAFVQIFLKTGALRGNIFIRPEDLNAALMAYKAITLDQAQAIFDKYRN